MSRTAPEGAGRILKWYGDHGEIEVASTIAKGQVVSFVDGIGKETICRVTRTSTTGVRGQTANIELISGTCVPPATYSTVSVWDPPVMKGSLVTLGSDDQARLVKVRVNDLFQHTILMGKTQSGKTHMALEVCEELALRRVPNLIFDTQGEFCNLGLSRKGVLLLDKPDIDAIVKALKRRKTVVFDLLDYSDSDRGKVVANVITAIVKEKEMTYKHPDGADEFPPLIITIDEAEVYAPQGKHRTPAVNVITDVAKRRSKFGIGLLLLVQRLRRFDTDVRSQCKNLAVFTVTDPSDLQIISIWLGRYNYLKGNYVQQLRQGQCYLSGGWVPFTTLITTGQIQTMRTKTLDFEAMLGLEKERYEPTPERRKPSENDGNDDLRVACSACQKDCERKASRGHNDVQFNHLHFQCPGCGDEWCTTKGAWLSVITRSVKQRGE